MPATFPPPVQRFLAAVNEQDHEAAGACFTPQAQYHFLVPHPAVVGREAITKTLRSSLEDADWVRWDVVTHAQNGDLTFLERIDHFGFGDKTASIECLGVFRVEGDLIAEVRDYADLGTWRDRKSAAKPPTT